VRLHPNAKLTPMARRLLVDRVESLGWAVARAARAAGVRLTAAYPLGPLTEGAGMNIMVVSYMDSVDFGIIACERSVPHVADIALGFGARRWPTSSRSPSTRDWGPRRWTAWERRRIPPRRPRRETDMWERLRHALWRHWRWSQRGPDERRAAKARARFWVEVREGQRKAEELSGRNGHEEAAPTISPSTRVLCHRRRILHRFSLQPRRGTTD